MKEFGSNFHYISNLNTKDLGNQLPKSARYYANGRQAIQNLIWFNGWSRIWMPEYFCYEIIDAIRDTGIEVKYYIDRPDIVDDDNVISKIPFVKGDVLFRMNYFGLRSRRDNSAIAVPVIEDHSHGLIGDWVSNSNSDWCIASLRKSLPLAEGGILWSPKNHMLPNVVESSYENDVLAEDRLRAMMLKSNYLEGEISNKEEYLKIFNKTEAKFVKMGISGISKESYAIARSIDIKLWYEKKKNNWYILSHLSHPCIKILLPESSSLYPFSLIIKFNDNISRNNVRDYLLKHDVFPAILWYIPNSQSLSVIEFGETSLSIHCDARYSQYDINTLRNLLFESFSKIK